MVKRITRLGAKVSRVRRALGNIWHLRRWIYGTWILLAITRIPARTGFRLSSPECDTALNLENLALSLTKVPHFVLFGAFFLVTLMQFDRVDRRSLAWSVAATAVISVIIEIQQGATRTGNCRLTDVAPTLSGALIVAVLIAVAMAVRNRITAHASSEARQ